MNKLTEQELIELTVVYGNRHNACIAAKELLEARAELAAIKALPPIGRIISCSGNKTLGWINDAPEGTLLFTAAKLAGENNEPM